MKKINPAILELIKLGNNSRGVKINASNREGIRHNIRSAFANSKSREQNLSIQG